MQLTRKIFNWYSDPGHAWLEVTRAELISLGIENRISGYSYQKFDFVYLEEDSDAGIFIDAWERRTGLTFTDRNLKYIYRAVIRGYRPFKPTATYNFTLNFADETIKPRETPK